MNNLEKLQAARVAYDAAHVSCAIARVSYETEIEATLSKVVEVLEYADRMVRLDLRHMTDVGCEDFSQAVVDTGERIKATLAELTGETE